MRTMPGSSLRRSRQPLAAALRCNTDISDAAVCPLRSLLASRSSKRESSPSITMYGPSVSDIIPRLALGFHDCVVSHRIELNGTRRCIGPRHFEFEAATLQIGHETRNLSPAFVESPQVLRRRGC